MTITAAQKAGILADYRAGKVKTATELGKKFNVSRSAVYRVLTAAKVPEAEKPQRTVELRNTIESVTKTKPSLRMVAKEMDAESDSGSEASQVSHSFFQRSEKFADSLGLPEPTGVSHHVDDKQAAMDDEEREENIEAAMGMVLGAEAIGAPPKSRLLEELDSAFAKPPPPRAAAKPEKVAMEDDDAIELPRAVFVDRGDLTQRILFNVENFGPLLTGIVGTNPSEFIQGLERRGDLELKALLNTLERTRSVGNLAGGFKQTFYAVSQATEVVTKLAGMKTEGFVEHLRQQDTEILMIMKELAIDQWERLKTMNTPEMRLGALFCLTLVQTDAANRMKSHLSNHLNAPVGGATVAQHADL